jgi:1,4-alpha-glucan branching enzyme
VTYVTNHDEAANRRDGATGSYVATLLKNAHQDWFYVEKKTMAYGAAAMLSSSAYLDMPQMRLLQEGTFTDNSAVDWSLLGHKSQQQVYAFFADLSQAVQTRPAFAFHNLHENIENHVDTFSGWRIVSFMRRDAATGKKLYAVVNFGHVGVSGYQFGVDASGDFKLVINSDAKKYGGSGEFEKRSPSGSIAAGGDGRHGKSHTMTLPYLAPYSALLLEQQ